MISKKHRVFCSYAFTGEDEATVEARMKVIARAFKDAGVQAYCNLFDTKVEGFTQPKQFIDAALAELKTCDMVFVVQASHKRSEGMLIEIGAAYAAGKPIILARHHSAQGKTYLDQLATKTVDWQTNDDLAHLIPALIV